MPGNTHRLIWYCQLARLVLINHWKLFGDEQCKIPIPNMNAKQDKRRLARIPRVVSACKNMAACGSGQIMLLPCLRHTIIKPLHCSLLVPPWTDWWPGSSHRVSNLRHRHHIPQEMSVMHARPTILIALADRMFSFEISLSREETI